MIDWDPWVKTGLLVVLSIMNLGVGFYWGWREREKDRKPERCPYCRERITWFVSTEGRDR